MNAKRAKALRKFLRVTELDPKQRQYQVKTTKQVLRRLDDGAVMVENRLQMRLHPDSGRAVYRRLKPLWA